MTDTLETPTTVRLDPEAAPRLPFLHMWTDADGQSRLDLSAMTGFGKKSVGGDADPQFLRPFPGAVAQILFAQLPVGWVGEWHESPAPQWVVPLRGRWFLETMSGQRVIMGPGDIHYGHDQDTTDRTGHRSGQVGEEPCYQMILQFAQDVAAQTPDPFGG